MLGQDYHRGEALPEGAWYQAVVDTGDFSAPLGGRLPSTSHLALRIHQGMLPRLSVFVVGYTVVIISFCYTFVVIGCMGFSLVEVSGGYSLVTVRRLLIVLASLIAERELQVWDMVGSVRRAGNR